jgi:alkylhydroperoxidase/carboxymuconolactone decarboxylase family protein YurZ
MRAHEQALIDDRGWVGSCASDFYVRAGLQRSGFTREELKEVLMQTAIYAGVPAANTASAEAAAIMVQLEEVQGPL